MDLFLCSIAMALEFKKHSEDALQAHYLAHLCKNRNRRGADFRVKYFASYKGKELIPAFKGNYKSDVFDTIGYTVKDNNIIHIDKADVGVSMTGPFYNWDHRW